MTVSVSLNDLNILLALPNQAYTNEHWNTISQATLFFSSLSFLNHIFCSNSNKSICPALPTSHRPWPLNWLLFFLESSLLLKEKWMPLNPPCAFAKLKCAEYVFTGKPWILVQDQMKLHSEALVCEQTLHPNQMISNSTSSINTLQFRSYMITHRNSG